MPKMNCKCGALMEVTEPKFEVINGLTLSAIVLNNALMGGTVCPKCRTGYIPVIKDFNPQGCIIGMVEIPVTDVPSGLVDPAGKPY
jgi:hypothetical protein